MTQTSLDWQPIVARAVKAADEQAKHLERVADRIAALVLDWCAINLKAGTTFHMADLVEFVCLGPEACSPDSPSRILRMLRRKGRLDYVVVSRSQSLYRVTAVR